MKTKFDVRNAICEHFNHINRVASEIEKRRQMDPKSRWNQGRYSPGFGSELPLSFGLVDMMQDYRN